MRDIVGAVGQSLGIELHEMSAVAGGQGRTFLAAWADKAVVVKWGLDLTYRRRSPMCSTR
jgi:hypothetical protein